LGTFEPWKGGAIFFPIYFVDSPYSVVFNDLCFVFCSGQPFGFPRLVFCSAFGAILLDGFVFCRPLFSTKSPVSTFSRNEQGDGRSQSGLQDFEVFEVLLLTKLQLVVAIQNTLDLIWFDAIFIFICILYIVYSIIFMISSVSSPQEVT
jgi:hypothetical protein